MGADVGGLVGQHFNKWAKRYWGKEKGLWRGKARRPGKLMTWGLEGSGGVGGVGKAG